MAVKKTQASAPPPVAEEAPLMRGTFCDLSKYGGDGWGIAIEENGDIAPGQMISVKRKDGDYKPIKLREVIYEDSFKVVATIEPDPNDRPPGARKGKVLKKRELTADLGGDADPRAERRGGVRWSGEVIDLGGTKVAKGRIDFNSLLDLA